MLLVLDIVSKKQELIILHVHLGSGPIVLKLTGTAYASRAPRFIPSVLVLSVLSYFYVLFVVVLCLVHCCLLYILTCRIYFL